jgi:hypothetical protein
MKCEVNTAQQGVEQFRQLAQELLANDRTGMDGGKVVHLLRDKAAGINEPRELQKALAQTFYALPPDQWVPFYNLSRDALAELGTGLEPGSEDHASVQWLERRLHHSFQTAVLTQIGSGTTVDRATAVRVFNEYIESQRVDSNISDLSPITPGERRHIRELFVEIVESLRTGDIGDFYAGVSGAVEKAGGATQLGIDPLAPRGPASGIDTFKK